MSAIKIDISEFALEAAASIEPDERAVFVAKVIDLANKIAEALLHEKFTEQEITAACETARMAIVETMFPTEH